MFFFRHRRRPHRAIPRGTFSGAQGHDAAGTVEILREDGRTTIRFGSDFFLDGAPDPKIGFGRNRFVDGTIISELKTLKGRQDYVVPASIDVSEFNEIWLWCERFGVPLGVAKVRQAIMDRCGAGSDAGPAATTHRIPKP